MGVLGHARLGITVLGQPEATGGGTGGSAVADSLGNGLDVRRFYLGDVVHLLFTVTDDVGTAVATGGYALVVRHEAGTLDDITAGVTSETVGSFVAGYAPAALGRHVATFAATGDYAGVASVIFDVDALDLAFITLDELRDYLGATSATDDDLTTALRAERAAQAQRCRIDPYTYELREALMRRVARNLAARSVPVATYTSFEGGATSTRVPSVDAELRRLEGAYRKLVCG